MSNSEKMISRTISWSVRSRYGDFNEVKSRTNNFSMFYMDVLDLLYLTSRQYNLTINHVLALFNTYSQNDNFKINDTPTRFRVVNLRKELSEFINSTHVSKKRLHGQIVELILKQGVNPQEILGSLIKIKNDIDKEFTYVNQVETKIEIKQEKPKVEKRKTKSTKSKVPKKKEQKVTTDLSKENKTKSKDQSKKEQKVTTSNKVESKKVSLSELNKTKPKKEKSKVNEEKTQVESNQKEESEFSKLVRETKEAIQINDLLNDFL